MYTYGCYSVNIKISPYTAEVKHSDADAYIIRDSIRSKGDAFKVFK